MNSLRNEIEAAVAEVMNAAAAAGQGWRDDALCRQTDPEAFFPENGGSTQPARQVCAACPVRADCLAEAIRAREPHGVWGGMSYRERQAYAHQAEAPVTARGAA